MRSTGRPAPRPARPARPARTRVAAAVLPLLLAVLASCGYGSHAAPSGSSAAPASGKRLSASTVRIGFFADVTHATPLVGLEEGLFQEELGHTAIRTQVFGAGPAEVEALNAGAVDIGWLGPSPALNGYTASHGRDLRIVSGATSGGASLVVDPRRVRSVPDLRGRTIASPQLGNTQDVALLNYLAGHGYREDPQTGKGDVDVDRVPDATVLTAFKQGRVDGAWVPEPTASELVAEGGERLVDEDSLWPGGRFTTTDVVVSQAFLAAHPDVVRAVLRGSVATNAWIHAHPAAAKRAIDAQLRKLTGKALSSPVLDAAFGQIRVGDDPLAATLREEARHAVTAGLLDHPYLHGIYDLKPLDAVLASRGEPAVSDAGL